MTKEQAIAILQQYNYWRRGDECEAPNPTQIGLAIDYAIKYMEIGIIG